MVEPDPASVQRHRGTRAVQRMVEYAPSSGGLALWVQHQDLPDGAALPQAAWLDAGPAPSRHPAAAAVPAAESPVATDGRTVCYRPAFDALPLPLQTGWVAHAVLHTALRHPQRCLALRRLLGDVDLALFNTCADAIVNSALSHLGWLALPPQAVRLDQLLAAALGEPVQADAALLQWDVERLYRLVDDRRPPPDGGRRAARQPGEGREPQAAGSGGGVREDGPRAARVRALGQATAIDLLPDAQAAGAPEDEADASREWTERIARAHAGDGAHSMLRALLADLPRSHTPWQQVLRTRLARGLSRQPALSWSRPARSYIANQGRAGPHRRMPWEPGTSGSRRTPRLAVVVDVSGSVDAALLARFATEVEAITRRQEAALVLVIGDDQVRQVQHFAPGRARLGGLAVNGGGGTDFTPLLQEADRHRPDITVVLTDLQGPALHRPGGDLIWALPEAWQHAVPPFGRVLVLR